ncbi:MAG: hypothetical protein HKM07_07875 [Chlamydiae bacterium]|jgi:antitoxin component YwqK of YwqJK toxin-antitoxin module|nr:hypothetical protein [Chlamydiota bacterium]
MNNKFYLLLGTVAVLATSCNDKKTDEQIVSQSYMHKSGYAISKQEWEAQNYPGQVVTTLRDGVTIYATYEDGVLHGPSSHTYPHSKTIESYFLYNEGDLVKETYYDTMGMPIKENSYVSPTRYTATVWYKSGSPLSVEEFSGNELLDGQYFNTKNEVDARVIKGKGHRIIRDNQGILKIKDEVQGGFIVKRETFYPSGTPESIAIYVKGLPHGTKKTFAETGEPLAIEEWAFGLLHGNSVYFKNGAKYLETSYEEGKKEGYETHYANGDTVIEKTLWLNDRKHGPSNFYIDGSVFTTWFYDDEAVSQKKYIDMRSLDEKIISASEDFDMAEVN